MYCYLSPSPKHQLLNKESNGKLLCSPPLLACKKYDELSPRSLDLQLKSGRSLFQSNPAAVRMMDVQTILANDTRSGEAMILTVPAHPHLETDDDELEEDMPVIVTPKLMMRPKSATGTENGLHVASAAAPFINMADCSFAKTSSS